MTDGPLDLSGAVLLQKGTVPDQFQLRVPEHLAPRDEMEAALLQELGAAVASSLLLVAPGISADHLQQASTMLVSILEARFRAVEDGLNTIFALMQGIHAEEMEQVAQAAMAPKEEGGEEGIQLNQSGQSTIENEVKPDVVSDVSAEGAETE